MKKGILILVFALLFFLPNNVEARLICTNEAQTASRINASNVKLSYELKKDDNIGYYFKIYYMNLTEDLEIVYGDKVYTYDKDANKKEFINYFTGGETYEFLIRIAYGNRCAGTIVANKKIQVPAFNIYSIREECIEYEEFPLCNKYYSGKIESDEFFLKKLEEYKKSLEKEEEIKVPEEETIFDKIIDFYVDNLIWTLPLTILVIGGVVTLIVIKQIKKKKRIKIEI